MQVEVPLLLTFTSSLMPRTSNSTQRKSFSFIHIRHAAWCTASRTCRGLTFLTQVSCYFYFFYPSTELLSQSISDPAKQTLKKLRSASDLHLQSTQITITRLRLCRRAADHYAAHVPVADTESCHPADPGCLL